MDELKYMKLMSIIIVIFSIIIVLFQLNTSQARDYGSWLQSCESHRKQIESILTSEGLSTKYYYLMVAESRCKIDARSNKGALGFWQLMPETARKNGCTNPHDIECATRAAAKYIKSLEKRFDRFEDVIIAYNMGGHNYIKYGKSAQALGLVRRVRMIEKADKR